MRPISKDEQLKLKMNPFTPVAYNKYTHQLIDSHMANHTKRITAAKSRIDTSIPKSAVSCIRSRDRFKLPAKNELLIELENAQLPQNYFEDLKEGQEFSELFKLEHCHSNRSLSKTRITKTGKQAISRKTTSTTTTIPWKHTSRMECLGKTTNFPSLVTSVCATQLATKRMQRNVKYQHVKSKIRQLYFNTEKINEKKLENQKSVSFN
ncbi:hypothetical protein LOD99_9197 [Oopsacas minuta]|uniref:Uncharacterized protein n=1 Tax=Oopsacas minuta TaxID=111878 RepID=A0AAV7JDC6_9METZ|nr:hypothetical protein LOD99_9197 [Oopsacas minuta]